MTMVEGQLTSLAFCWRLERRDGAGLALTSHDQRLSIDGINYEPSPGMTPAAVRLELGLGGNSSEVAGSLSSAAISDGDIEAGRWDGAGLCLFAVDWTAPDSGQQPLLQGELGQVAAKDGEFGAELLGVAAKLERPACPVTSPECRAELGDRDCRIDMAGRRCRAIVIGVEGACITLDRQAEDRFRFGAIRFLNGAANGLKSRILSIEGPTLSILGAPCGEIGIGTHVELTEGCDKRFETCVDRFANAGNFRGEPHLPGNDLLTRYPGS